MYIPENDIAVLIKACKCVAVHLRGKMVHQAILDLYYEGLVDPWQLGNALAQDFVANKLPQLYCCHGP